MDAYKVNIKEEIAIRHWQNVISFGTDSGTKQNNNVQQSQTTVAFEVLP